MLPSVTLGAAVAAVMAFASGARFYFISVIGERSRAGRPTTVLVKITQASLQDNTLAQFIQEKLAKHGADGHLLVLQLPESKVFTHLRAAQQFYSKVTEIPVEHHARTMGKSKYGLSRTIKSDL